MGYGGEVSRLEQNVQRAEVLVTHLRCGDFNHRQRVKQVLLDFPLSSFLVAPVMRNAPNLLGVR